MNNRPSKSNPVDKHRLRSEARRIARDLIDADVIETATEVLADYRKRFGRSDDGYLRHGLALMFVLDLVRNCQRQQARRVAHIIDEHLVCGSAATQQTLRSYELEMFIRFGDAESAKTCARRLADLDDVDR